MVTDETIIAKDRYADICIYIKQIESLDINQLYTAIKSYLSCLILPNSSDFLSVYAEHLNISFSWLSKAQLISQAESQKDFAEAEAASTDSADRLLWEDVAKKLNYLISTWNPDDFLSLQQIVQGISTLITDNIALEDVQEEIVEFAEARNVLPLTDGDISARLQHLLGDAWVNSSTLISKMVRTIVVQAELYLNRLQQMEISFNHLDAKQSFLFHTNYKLCQFIQSQILYLQDHLTLLPHTIVAKMDTRLEQMPLSAVLGRYEAMVLQESSTLAPTAAPDIHDDYQIRSDYLDERQAEISSETARMENMIPEPSDILVKEDPREAVDTRSADVIERVLSQADSSAPVSHHALEKALADSEELLSAILEKVSLHRLQLTCFTRIKACYAKFILFPVFRKIATQLTHHQSSILDSLSTVKTVAPSSGLSHEKSQQLNGVTHTLERCLDRIKTYLKTLNVHHEDYNVNHEISSWQSRLHDVVLYSSEKELLDMEARLQNIEAISSPYLRATLIMKFDVTKMKLNDMIIANMQSWSSKLVDRETVINTLNYLGIRIHPDHLSKIAPTVHIPKSRTKKKKNIYSMAANYSMTAWRQLREWLNQSAIH